jgi:hypothetical protein
MTSAQSCPLLDLPAELRNHIYDWLLIPGASEEDDDYGIVTIRYDSKIKLRWKPPPITQISRQVRRETTTIYYGENTFRITLSPRDVRQPLHPWLRALSPEIRGMLRDIQLDLDYDYAAKARDALDFFHEGLAEDGVELQPSTLAVGVLDPPLELPRRYGPYYDPGGVTARAVIPSSYVWTDKR